MATFIALILVLIWFLGLISGALGSAVHLILVAALVILMYGMIEGRHRVGLHHR